MDERPDPKPDPFPEDGPWVPVPAEEWGGAPVTKFLCPVHAVPEEWQIVSHEGQRLIRYACPVEGCDHEWTVKRIRP